ncbi:MAG: hypothetical protein GXP37_00665 [Chloroflexi bacterium]|nr:hypothetical protein [Chloroflexota bacterium]
MKWALVAGTIVVVLALGVLLWAYADVSLRYRHLIVSPEQITEPAVVLVLGAGIYPDGYLSTVLSDRMLTAIELYKSGKARRLLLSGDNRFVHYNEPGAMAAFARTYDVPESVLALDYAGRRTYDSCYRARYIFGQQRLIVVSQSFHLPRALYLCQSLGIDAVGVVADRRVYQARVWFGVRETVARVRAWFDMHVLHPFVVGGDPIDI